jgi:ABC-type bacteriocin/lantibiotic exporter with double-glycine peptidase domain
MTPIAASLGGMSLSSTWSKRSRAGRFAHRRSAGRRRSNVSGLQSVGVFALLFVGGIMVLNGKTEIGIVVAFISGLDRVIDPWRELIAFVRSTSAAKVQFDLIEDTLGRKL